MAYFEMVLLVLVALVALVLLALAVSSGPVSHLHATHLRDRHAGGLPIRYRNHNPPAPVAPDYRAQARRSDPVRGDLGAGDWSRLMETPSPRDAGGSGSRSTTLEAGR